MRRWINIVVLAATGLTGFAGAPGEAAMPEVPTPPEDVGSVSVELRAAGDLRLASVAYHVTGPRGFDKTGIFDVSGSSTVSGVVPALPAGGGYTVALTALDLGGRVGVCAGSAAFAVAAGAVTPVAVHLTCHEGTSRPPVPVPIPRWAPLALALAVLALGAARAARRR